MTSIVKYFFYILLCVSSFLFISCEKKEATPDWAEHSEQIQISESNNQSGTDDIPDKTSTNTKSKAKPDGERITFMYYNLRNYLTMRRGDSERPKPEEEIVALIQNIKKVNPDILAVCEIGNANDLADLKNRLAKVGVHFLHSYLTMGSDPTRRQAILSIYPIQPHKVPKYTYTMKGKKFEIKRGILDVTTDTPNGIFRFLGVHLKSKRPSKEFDHDLVRRNEALILRKHITSLLANRPYKLLVYGDMNDTKNSPVLRSIKGPYRGKLSIRPIDNEAPDGTRWTQYWSYQDIYSRFDFALTSEHMTPHIDRKQSSILEVPKNDPASDHRALIISIK